nr:hypothetical protein [Tanacetum cinerariifolium]
MFVDESLEVIADESLEMIEDESLDMIVDEPLMVEDKSLEKLVDEILKLDEEHFEYASMGIEGFLRCMLDAKSWITYDNINRNTTLSEAQGGVPANHLRRESGCSKVFATFYVANISLGLLDKLESSPPIRHIQDFDESKDHCLTLKNTSYPPQRYAVYNILVNEKEPTGFTSIRRIHQEDTAYPCLHFKDNHDGLKTQYAVSRSLYTPYRRGLPHSSFLSTLLPSLFRASSISTTLSFCLQTLEDAACRIGVASQTRGFKDIIVGFNESWADHRIRVIRSRRPICDGVFSGVLAVKVEAVIDGSSLALGPGKGVKVPRMAPLIVQIWTRSGFDGDRRILKVYARCRVLDNP